MVRISGSSRPSGIHKTNTSAKRSGSSSSGKASSGGERVQVSDASSLREKAKAMLADMPEVRLQQIEGIRSALESGSYQFDHKQVASQIVRNALAEHSWK